MAAAYFITTVEDVVAAAEKARALYNDHFGHLQLFAPAARELLGTVDHYSTVLDDVASVLQRYRDSLTQQTSFNRRIDACEELISGRPDIYGQNDGAVRRIKKKLSNIWKANSNLDQRERSCSDLRRTLENDIHKLLSYIVLTALRRTVPVIDAGSSSAPLLQSSKVREQIRATLERRSKFGLAVTGQAEADLGIDIASPFDLLFAELIRLRSFYERSYHQTVQRGVPRNTEILRKRLFAIWQVLNARVGQVNEKDGRAPDFPADINAAFQGPFINYLDINIEISNTAKHLKTAQQHPTNRSNTFTGVLPQSFARSSSHCTSVVASSTIGISPADFTPPTSPIRPKAGVAFNASSFVDLPGSIIGSQVAEITLWHETNRERIVYLNNWQITPVVNKLRCIRWEGDILGVELLHYVPANAFPQVYHACKSSRKEYAKKARQVFFEDKHRIVYRVSEQILCDEKIRPSYTFLTISFLLDFLQALRGKSRIAWYDMEVIWSNDYAQKNDMGALAGLGRQEKLILWQDKSWPYRHSISFFSNKTELEQLEYPLLWFKEVKEVKKTGDVVKIESGDSEPEGVSDNELEAAQLLEDEFGQFNPPKWLKMHLSGSGSELRESVRDLVNRVNAGLQYDKIVRPKPPRVATTDSTSNWFRSTTTAAHTARFELPATSPLHTAVELPSTAEVGELEGNLLDAISHPDVAPRDSSASLVIRKAIARRPIPTRGDSSYQRK